MEVDISNLPPGEVLQIVWNGTPVFVRRLTQGEVTETNSYPPETILDKGKEVILSVAGNLRVTIALFRVAKSSPIRFLEGRLCLLGKYQIFDVRVLGSL